MTPTTTFQDSEKVFTFTVKATFLEKCPEPSKYDVITLNKDYHMLTYLHNEVGPAIINHIQKIDEFWLDGKHLVADDPKKAAEFQAKIEFNKKFDDFVNDGESK